jgi:hypothetical protein
MATLYKISDSRTKFCRAAMKANNAIWNPIMQAWMFVSADDAANALSELYLTTRPSLNQRDALFEMAADGTGASAWDFDPAVDADWLDRLDREKASALLAAATRYADCSDIIRSKTPLIASSTMHSVRATSKRARSEAAHADAQRRNAAGRRTCDAPLRPVRQPARLYNSPKR